MNELIKHLSSYGIIPPQQIELDFTIYTIPMRVISSIFEIEAIW